MGTTDGIEIGDQLYAIKWLWAIRKMREEVATDLPFKELNFLPLFPFVFYGKGSTIIGWQREIPQKQPLLAHVESHHKAFVQTSKPLAWKKDEENFKVFLSGFAFRLSHTTHTPKKKRKKKKGKKKEWLSQYYIFRCDLQALPTFTKMVINVSKLLYYIYPFYCTAVDRKSKWCIWRPIHGLRGERSDCVLIIFLKSATL